MYEQHWGLKRLPFRNVPEAEFFFRSDSHAAALLKLRYMVENRLRGGLLLGGSGIGKTCLVKLLAHQFPENFGPVAHLIFPQLSVTEMLAWIAIELGAEEKSLTADESGLDRSVRQIERQLIALTERGRRPMIVIDEAHLIDDPQVLQALCLLLNCGDRPEIEMTLLLVGDWMLSARIGRIGSFDDRIAVRSVLTPLTLNECAGYVGHRLNSAGAKKPIFDASALQAIFAITGGVPRKINHLCDLALLVGFADNKRSISANDVETVAAELSVGAAAA